MPSQRHLHIADPMPVQRCEQRLEPVGMFIDDGKVGEISNAHACQMRYTVVKRKRGGCRIAGFKRTAGRNLLARAIQSG